MNILITNDDGFESKGIAVLTKIMKKYGNVAVIAPFSARRPSWVRTDWSTRKGGHILTLRRPAA